MNVKNFLWLLPFFSFLCGYQLLKTMYNVNEFTAPSIVGKQLPQAFAILSNHNLNPRILAEKEDPDLPAGTVLSQTPRAQTAIKPNQSVFCVVSKKPKQEKAPYFMSRSFKQIQQECKEKGIRNKSYFLPSNYPQNQCLAQSPAPNHMLENNKIITYVSSGNTKPVIFPDLKGQLITNVVTFLEKRGIQANVMHTTARRHDHACTRCTVKDQRPLAGSLVTLSPENPLSVQLQA